MVKKKKKPIRENRSILALIFMVIVLLVLISSVLDIDKIEYTPKSLSELSCDELQMAVHVGSDYCPDEGRWRSLQIDDCYGKLITRREVVEYYFSECNEPKNK